MRCAARYRRFDAAGETPRRTMATRCFISCNMSYRARARTFTAWMLLPSAESFELVARQPVHGPFLQQRLPAQCKAELGDRRIAREIHRGRVFIAGPVI